MTASNRALRLVALTLALGSLAACSSPEAPAAPVPSAPGAAPLVAPPVPPPAPAPAPVAPAGAAAPAPVAAVPGNVVLANYHQLGKYYLGVVTAVSGDQLSVLYADGDSETVWSRDVLPDRVTPTLPGEVLNGQTYQPVTIEHRVGHALGLLYPSGERRWTSVALVRVDAASLPGTLYAPAPPVAFGQAGSVVLARYTGDGNWYEAVVGELVGDLRRVVYADGASEDLPMEALREGGIPVGADVHVRVPRADEVLSGRVLLRAHHAVQLETTGGERRWAAVSLVRMPGAVL